MVIPSALPRPGSMSDAESVTMATRLTTHLPAWSRARRPAGAGTALLAADCRRRDQPSGRSGGSLDRYAVLVNRSLWAVLFGTFTLRFSTGLTGLALTYYLRDLHLHRGIVDQLLGLGPNGEVGSMTFGVIAALFFVSELTLSPVFGIISDRLGHYRVMQFGPIFGIVAVLATWATTSLPLIGGTRLLEGSATASSVPSILGFIAVVTASD